MKKFDVEITETLQRKVSVEAASQEDAERMVTQAWNNQDYVLDSGDFTGVDFKTVGEHELAETRTMNVLLVQPNAYPKKISVGTELEDLQAMVGGDIEVTYPFEDEVAIILNESGKINGLPLNRAIYTEDGDMDEFHLLLKEEQTAAYSVEIWKRFRKWGGIPTGITQNVKDLLSSREVTNIFENSDFIYMLNQAAGDRQILADQLNISPHQLSYVTHSGEGEGLLFYGNVILPFVDRFPTDLELYRIMTTKLTEVQEAKEA